MKGIDRGIEFTEKQKEVLRKFCSEPSFIDDLLRIGKEYRTFSDRKKHSLKDARITLQSIQDKSDELLCLIKSLNGNSDPLKAILARCDAGYKLIARLSKDLKNIKLNAMHASIDLEEHENLKIFRSRNNKVFLVSEVESILNKYSIDVTLTTTGAWCKCIGIILDLCHEAKGEPKNYIREYQNRRMV